MTIDEIRALIKYDMDTVDKHIALHTEEKIPLIQSVSGHIIESGGKRLRPMLLLLSANGLYCPNSDPQILAAVIELIHTATLLHDDVVDGSDLRRGRPTANGLWGNCASILVGDFIYSRCFQMLVTLQKIAYMEVIAAATNHITRGEVMQLSNRHNTDTTEAFYMDTIEAKTATLFAASTKLGAIAANSDNNTITAMEEYGLKLGLAFQLIDDALDYEGSTQDIGKNVGDDLAEGRATLPLIYAMQHGTKAQRDIIKAAITEGKLEQLANIQQALLETNAIDYTHKLAKRYSQEAIASLPNTLDKHFFNALEFLANYAVERKK